MHRESNGLAQTHGHLVPETLSTAGPMRTRMARSLADSAWAMFAQVLSYKLEWRGGKLTLADRDTNAAACLAQYPGLQWPPVAAKQAETINVRREESAGEWDRPTRKTVLVEVERASARRPRRAVLAA